MQQLGELVIATGADTLNTNELAGALIVLAETKEAGKRGGMGQARGRVFSKPGAANCTNNCPQHGRPCCATERRATGIKPQGRDMTCAHGRSSAESARGIS